jgi:hypothetical protein
VAQYLDEQADYAVDFIRKNWTANQADRISVITNLVLPPSAAEEMKSGIERLLTALMRRGEEILERGYSRGRRTEDGTVEAWASTKASQIVQSEVQRVTNVARSQALTSARKDATTRETAFEVRRLVEKAQADWVGTDGVFSVAEALSVSTAMAIASDARVKYAQWSAILDTVVCPLCEWRDGQVILKEDPDFLRWEPPIHFGPCRCGWVPVRGEAMPTWKKTVPARLMKYFMLEAQRNHAHAVLT